MKIGKLYKHMDTGVVVECTTPVNDGLFGGSVVNGDDMYNIGDYFAHWVCNSFEEYEPTKTLTNGCTYNIPEGCEAIIKDGAVTIKDKIEYFKVRSPMLVYTIYIRKHLDKQINVYTYINGDMAINHHKIDVKDKCTKKEFIEAYNKAMNIFKL